MSATWTLLSPLPPRDAIALEDACQKAVAAWLSEHPDCLDDYGELSAGGTVPDPDDVARDYRRLRLALPVEVVDRLATCRSALTIERPGMLDMDALQVSILRFLLERIGAGLVMFNDYPLLTAEEAIEEVRRKKGVRGFAAGAAPAPRKPAAVKARPEKPGEVRALRVLQAIETAEEDVDLAIDLRDAFRRLPPPARRYVELLVSEGPVEDARAMKALGLGADEFQKAVELVDRVVRELA